MKRLAVLNLIQLVTTRKRPKGTTYIHVNLINHYCVEKCVLSGSILRKKQQQQKKELISQKEPVKYFVTLSDSWVFVNLRFQFDDLQTR